MQTGVCRWSEACARGHAVGKKAVWLQQKYHTNRLCETCFVGTVERSAKRIVIARKEFKFIGLHARGICKQMVGFLILEPAVILRCGMMHCTCNDAGKSQHH